MKKIFVVLLCVLFGACVFAQDVKTQKTRTRPIKDGFALNHLDGKLSRSDDGAKWVFSFYSDLTAGTGRIKAATAIEMLPSSTLEKMAAQFTEDKVRDFRIWGRLTKFTGTNFIFCTYSLPITEASEMPLDPTDTIANTKIPEANDFDVIPKEVMAMLKSRRVVNLAKLKQGVESKKDGIIVDETGIIKKGQDGSDFVFAFDGLGRNVGKVFFKLLPCEIVEQVVSKKIALGRRRYKVAGILTKYNGQYYLLLQRATRAYSHNNFAR